ncbi:hypothetical protein JD969_10840 [Planctomycetota bacterium]|nr:hypothetical protein JD969_10840 [Planctomycetota bacterium]
MRLLVTFTVSICVLLIATQINASEDLRVRWWDGTVTSRPVGQLLSDNDGFWGERIVTGVTYTYESEPNAPADKWRNKSGSFGRRLLNGIGMRPPVPASWEATQSGWIDPYLSVGVAEGPLVVVFDFQRMCRFNEVDLLSQSEHISVEVSIRQQDDEAWQVVAEYPMEKLQDSVWSLRRIVFDKAIEAKYLRIKVEAAEGPTKLNQFFAWGEAEVEPTVVPPSYRPVVLSSVAETPSAISIPGVESTAFPLTEFWAWRHGLGESGQASAVWGELATWDRLTHEPILPDPLSDVQILMARNEIEPRALALVNTNDQQPLHTKVALSGFTRLEDNKPVDEVYGVIRVGGAIASKSYGVGIGPLFAREDLLDADLMQQYLANGYGIAHFPDLILNPAGAAVIWLEVHTQGAKPGVYQATLRTDEDVSLPIRVDVRNVTLPEAQAWVHSWSETTKSFPFSSLDRQVKEVDYKQSLGISVWRGLPEPGTINALARERGHAIFYDYILPWIYVDRGFTNKLDPGNITDEDEAAVRKRLTSFVERAKSLGLNYNQWFGELWDEPDRDNIAAFAAYAKLTKQIDPDFQLYCNPIFWIGGGQGAAKDPVVYEGLKGWYDQYVDVSAPSMLLIDYPKSGKLFDIDLSINAFYNVVSQHAKSERAKNVLYYRRLPWVAMRRGWDGWGYYSYSRPRGSAWIDGDRDLATNSNAADYQIVYPGPAGPIPTRASEAAREGWEDYRLIQSLQKKGDGSEAARLIEASKGRDVDLADLYQQGLIIIDHD